VAEPISPRLSDDQLRTFAEHGSERTAEVGEVLYDVGDTHYPFIVILDGEAAIQDAAGNEIVRHGASGFLGELNLMSGQTVFLRAVATEPMRYLAVERDAFRTLLVEDSALSDMILPTFIRRREALQQQPGVGVEIVGDRSDADTRRIVDFARRQRLPYSLVEPGDAGEPAREQPYVVLPGGPVLERPTNRELSRTLGIGLELKRREQVDLLVVGGGPAGLGAAVYGASEGLDTLVVESSGLGGQAGSSRRIENYLGFPGGISGTELASRAVTQARKFHARTASPYRAESLVAENGGYRVGLEGGYEVSARVVVIATGAEYRRLPVERLDEYEGITVLYSAGPPEALLCAGARVGVVGGGNSAAQAAIWLARGGALVTLLHRRADLRETMSDYLIHDLERYGVPVLDRTEIAELEGEHGELEAVVLRDGERLKLSYLFLFLGAEPCTDWLGDELRRDSRGFVLTGPDAGATGLLETSLPGVFAAGDVRANSIKRCATAVGEGATAIQLAHQHLSRQPDPAPQLAPSS